MANLSSGAVTTHAGLASGFTAGSALGGHGSLTGGVGTTSSLITLPPQPLPLVAVLIAKEVVSGQWQLSLTDMAGVIAAVAWSTNKPQPLLATAFRVDWFSSATPLMLVRPAQWLPITPSVAFVTPLPPVQWWDPAALPADLALYNRSGTSFGFFKAADGSEWLQLGGARLAVRVIDGS